MVKKRLLEQDLKNSGFTPKDLVTRCGLLGGSCKISFYENYTEEQKKQIENIVNNYTSDYDINYKTENPITEMVNYISKKWKNYISNK